MQHLSHVIAAVALAQRTHTERSGVVRGEVKALAAQFAEDSAQDESQRTAAAEMQLQMLFAT